MRFYIIPMFRSESVNLNAIENKKQTAREICYLRLVETRGIARKLKNNFLTCSLFTIILISSMPHKLDDSQYSTLSLPP